MCRNIKTLFNFDPHATEEEIRDASLQFVRKLSGFTKPSQTNEAAFDRAIEEVASAARTLLSSLTTNAEPRDRAEVAAKARAKAIDRFGLKDSRLQDQVPVKFHDQVAQAALSKLS